MRFNRRVGEVRSQVSGVVTGVAGDVEVQGQVRLSLSAWVRWRGSLLVSWPGCEVLGGCLKAVQGVWWRRPIAVVSWGRRGELRTFWPGCEVFIGRLVVVLGAVQCGAGVQGRQDCVGVA